MKSKDEIKNLALDSAGKENGNTYFTSISKSAFYSGVVDFYDPDAVYEFLYHYLSSKQSLSNVDYWVFEPIIRHKLYSLVEVIFKIPYPDQEAIASHAIQHVSKAFENCEEFIQKAVEVYDYSSMSAAGQWNLLVLIDSNSKALDILVNSGLSVNMTDNYGLPFWYIHFLYEKKHDLLVRYGADLFMKAHPERSEPLYNASKYCKETPLLHYIFANTNSMSLAAPVNLAETVIPQLSGLDLNVLDGFGRNILHVYLTENKREISSSIYFKLVDLGVDPNQKILISDKHELVSAKMTGQLPKGYGKSAREIYLELFPD